MSNRRVIDPEYNRGPVKQHHDDPHSPSTLNRTHMPTSNSNVVEVEADLHRRKKTQGQVLLKIFIE